MRKGTTQRQVFSCVSSSKTSKFTDLLTDSLSHTLKNFAISTNSCNFVWLSMTLCNSVWPCDYNFVQLCSTLFVQLCSKTDKRWRWLCWGVWFLSRKLNWGEGDHFPAVLVRTNKHLILYVDKPSVNTWQNAFYL